VGYGGNIREVEVLSSVLASGAACGLNLPSQMHDLAKAVSTPSAHLTGKWKTRGTIAGPSSLCWKLV
jgi:hypothetical protein